MTDDQRAERPGLRDFVAGRVARLQLDYTGGAGPVRGTGAGAELAKLRRGLGAQPGADFELVLLSTAGLEGPSAGDEPTDREHAAHAAITLYALHQQSQRNARMHQAKYSLGRSARLLAKRADSDDSVRRSLTRIATATGWDEVLHHARALIPRLRSEKVPLDYGQFAVDLLALRTGHGADAVRNRWGRDFYRLRDPETDGTVAASSQPE